MARCSSKDEARYRQIGGLLKQFVRDDMPKRGVNLEMTTSNNYDYKPLSSRKNIRILVLQPARQLNNPIECSLRVIRLEKFGPRSHNYEALSYIWGSCIGDQEIYCEGKVILVTRNCVSALRHLRKQVVERILWVDSICIDQSSIMERNNQVQLMGDVYRSARRVLVWLGQGTLEEHQLLRHIRCQSYTSSST
jgi:hypothetical protein